MIFKKKFFKNITKFFKIYNKYLMKTNIINKYVNNKNLKRIILEEKNVEHYKNFVKFNNTLNNIHIGRNLKNLITYQNQDEYLFYTELSIYQKSFFYKLKLYLDNEKLKKFKNFKNYVDFMLFDNLYQEFNNIYTKQKFNTESKIFLLHKKLLFENFKQNKDFRENIISNKNISEQKLNSDLYDEEFLNYLDTLIDIFDMEYNIKE